MASRTRQRHTMGMEQEGQQCGRRQQAAAALGTGEQADVHRQRWPMTVGGGGVCRAAVSRANLEFARP